MAGKFRYIVLLMLLIGSLFSYSQNTQRKKETLDYIDKYKDIAMTAVYHALVGFEIRVCLVYLIHIMNVFP